MRDLDPQLVALLGDAAPSFRRAWEAAGAEMDRMERIMEIADGQEDPLQRAGGPAWAGHPIDFDAGDPLAAFVRGILLHQPDEDPSTGGPKPPESGAVDEDRGGRPVASGDATRAYFDELIAGGREELVPVPAGFGSGEEGDPRFGMAATERRSVDDKLRALPRE